MALNGPDSFINDGGISFSSSMGVISSVTLCSSVVDFVSPIMKLTQNQKVIFLLQVPDGF